MASVRVDRCVAIRKAHGAWCLNRSDSHPICVVRVLRYVCSLHATRLAYWIMWYAFSTTSPQLNNQTTHFSPSRILTNKTCTRNMFEYGLWGFGCEYLQYLNKITNIRFMRNTHGDQHTSSSSSSSGSVAKRHTTVCVHARMCVECC